MKSAIIRVLALLLGLTIVLSGCGSGKNLKPDASDSPPSETSTIQPSDSGNISAVIDGGNTSAVINSGAFTTSYEYTSDDTDSSWDKNSATTIALGGNTADISGAGADFSGKTLTIKQAGTYVLSGMLTDGQVLIDAGADDVVRLVLNGVSLHHETGPAIYAPQSEKVVLILEKGTENKVSDGSGSAASESADEPDAAIFAQDNLSITGDGTLMVTGAYKHGIRAQDILAITGGVLSVGADGDALRGRDGVAIQKGSFTLEAGGDGIQSSNDEDDAKGFVIINDGAYTIQSANDGIQAQSSLMLTGGEFHITTGGGSANAPVREDDFRGGRAGWGGNTQTADTADTEETESMKALKAGKQLNITDGDITIDAEDDAVHSNGDITVTSGKLTIKSGDDGFHADAALHISGGNIEIPASYEGLEGLSVTITGGDIAVYANDDAINAAGGVDNASEFGGPMGSDRFSSNGERFVRISGGTIDLFAPHDGIDSNGDIFFDGGMVSISGPSQGMDGAIDLDGSFLVTGGQLITAGSVLTPSADSTQVIILVSYTTQQAADSVIAIKDASGNTLLEYTSKNSCAASGFTSPSFKVDETVSLFINGEKRTDIKLSGIITSIADDGGAYSGGAFNGGRGDRGDGSENWGGGMRPNGGNRPRPVPEEAPVPEAEMFIQ